MTTNYKGGKETSELLGVHQRTLYLWEAKGLIETVRTRGNKRLYNVDKFLQDKKCKEAEATCEDLNELDKKDKLKICYIREIIKKMI